jgi:predicted dehydrogenase
LTEVDHAGEVVGKNYYGTGHTAQLADFVMAITEKRAPGVSLADAANSAALVHAVYAASASGKWEAVKNYL